MGATGSFGLAAPQWHDPMNVLLFGTTGMVGQGALRECILDPSVKKILSIVRTASGLRHAKLRELTHKDFFDLSSIENQLAGYDACLFCLGVSSARMKEPEYRHLTYDLTLAVAEPLARLNPNMTFIYVSGMGTDSSERGRSMWARVKGKTENALLRLPFKRAYMFRPGVIVPKNGVRSKTRLYRLMYTLMTPVLPLWRAVFPKYIITTEQLGRAMIKVAKQGAPKPVLEARDINKV